jgi:hypothetical protein
MEFQIEQNGGAEIYYEYDCVSEDDIKDDTPVVKVYQNRRSFVVGTLSEEQYDLIASKIDLLKNGDGSPRSGGLHVKVFTPGEEIKFPRELITTDDYKYPGKMVCNSSSFTDDMIDQYTQNLNTYRVVGVDMIWCRENVLSRRLREMVSK